MFSLTREPSSEKSRVVRSTTTRGADDRPPVAIPHAGPADGSAGQRSRGTVRVRDLNWMQLEGYLRGDDRIRLPVGSTEQHAYLSLEAADMAAFECSSSPARFRVRR